MSNVINTAGEQQLANIIARGKVSVLGGAKGPGKHTKVIREISDSLTSIQNNFYAVLARTTNITKLRVALLGNQENIRKERQLESPILKHSGGNQGSAGDLTGTINVVSRQVADLTDVMKRLDLESGGGTTGIPDRFSGGNGNSRFGRLLPAMPAVSTMAAAAGAAAVTGGILWAVDRGMKNTYGAADDKLNLLEKKYGMKAIKNGGGFTSGWMIDGKRYSDSNLPEYYRMALDAEGPGANPKWGSTRRAMEYLRTHPRPGAEGMHHKPMAGARNPVASEDESGKVTIQPAKGSTTESKRAAALRAAGARSRMLAETAKRAAEGRPVPKQQPASNISEKSMAERFAERMGAFFGSLSDRIDSMGTSASESISQLTNTGASSYAEADVRGARGAWAQDQQFLGEVNRVSKVFNIDANDLLGLMQSESQINAQARNGGTGATGLIQFMPSTARQLGTSTDELSRMSRGQQMRFVEAYFHQVRLPRGANAGQLYGAVFLPGRVNQNPLTRSGEKYYGPNAGLDVDRNGDISQQDLIAKVSKKRQEIGLGPSKAVGGFSAIAGVIGNAFGGMIDSATSTLTGRGQFITPVASPVVTSSFGWRIHPTTHERKRHEGMDFGGSIGTPIHAVAGGTVVFADWEKRSNPGAGYGLYTKIDHGNGFVSLYAHLSGIRVQLGQQISQGQQIGAMGSTGRSTGPHLHFGLMRGGTFVNPASLLGAASVANSGPSEPGNEAQAQRQPPAPRNGQVATTAGNVAVQKKTSGGTAPGSIPGRGGGRHRQVAAPGTPAAPKATPPDPRPWYTRYFGL